MKRFRIRELIVKFPDPEESVAKAEAVNFCGQVTLLECANGVTAMMCANQTRLQPQCGQVTLLECANGMTHEACGTTVLNPGCQQVTLLECANGVTQMVCDGSTLEQACRRVTFPDCGLTGLGSPARPTDACGTHNQNVPACCRGCTHGRPCTDTAPTTYQACGNNCGKCTDDTPHCTSATDNCGSCTHATDDEALFVRTYDVDRMPLESLVVLKSQLSEVMQRAEIAETKFEPQTLEELDMAEKRLMEGLEEIRQMRAEREKKP